jgi:hypothetical protein
LLNGLFRDHSHVSSVNRLFGFRQLWVNFCP